MKRYTLARGGRSLRCANAPPWLLVRGWSARDRLFCAVICSSLSVSVEGDSEHSALPLQASLRLLKIAPGHVVAPDTGYRKDAGYAGAGGRSCHDRPPEDRTGRTLGADELGAAPEKGVQSRPDDPPRVQWAAWSIACTGPDYGYLAICTTSGYIRPGR